MITEARRDVTPFGEERLIRSTASDIAADRHGSEGAAVITLTPRDNTEFLGRTAFDMELAREFNGGLGGFGAAGSEINAAVCEIWRSEGEKACGQPFGGSGVKLRGVSKSDL